MRNWGAEDERARHCGSVAAVCRRFAHGFAVLLRWFALGLRMALRFCCGVLPRFTPVFFPLSGKKRRLAISCVSIPPGRDRHSCVLAVSVRLSAFVGSLRACAFLYGDPDGGRRDAEDAGTGNGVGGES